MGRKRMDASQKGAIIGGIISVFSTFAIVYYILFVLGGKVSALFLLIVAALTFVKVVWGVAFGYLVGSLFEKLF